MIIQILIIYVLIGLLYAFLMSKDWDNIRKV